MFLKPYNIVNLTNLASVICFLSPVQMSSVMNFPALQLTLLKSGLQTARKYGRSRPINSLPASVKRLATIAPKPNMNMRNAILVGKNKALIYVYEMAHLTVIMVEINDKTSKRTIKISSYLLCHAFKVIGPSLI